MAKIFRLEQCEHVPFNYGMKAVGSELFIMPDLVNFTNEYEINPSGFRNIIF
jgi:hypothetical protein